jgi:hypothetical protein
MNYYVPIILALFFISCDEEKPAPVASSPVTVKDTMTPRQQAVYPYLPVDQSPMDISYYPVDYPVSKMAGSVSRPPVARVIYSRPRKQGRQIFGKLLQYGQPWRLGANEATEIEFFQPVIILSTRVNKGRYILYCIPSVDKWKMVLNSNVDSWGLRQDTSKNVHEFTIPVAHLGQSIESFTIVFEEGSEEGASGKSANLVMAWDTVVAKLPIRIQ